MTFAELQLLPVGSIVKLYIKGGGQETAYTAVVVEPKRRSTTAVYVEVRACPNLPAEALALIETAPGGALFIHRADSTKELGFSAPVRVERP